MLCNNCGKPLEGKLTLCPECSAARIQASMAANGQEPSPENQSSAETTDQKLEELAPTLLSIPAGLSAAPRFHRFTAAIIDIALLNLTTLLLIKITSGIFGRVIDSTLVTDSAFSIYGIFICLILILITAVVVAPAYFILFESSAYQATLGKHLMGMYIVNSEGARPSQRTAVTRYLGKCLAVAPIFLANLTFLLAILLTNRRVEELSFLFIPLMVVAALFSVGLIWKTYVQILTDENGWGLHDRISGCSVVARSKLPPMNIVLTALTVAVIFIFITEAKKREFKEGARVQLSRDDYIQKETTSIYHEQTERALVDIEVTPLALPSIAPLQVSPTPALQLDSSSSIPSLADEAIPEQQITTGTSSASAEPIVSPVVTAAAEPTVEIVNDQPVEVEKFSNTVSFGNVKRDFPFSIAFLNSSRTQLRIYLGQNPFSSSQRSALMLHDVDNPKPPTASDAVFILNFPSPIRNDCSLVKASSVSVNLYDLGVAGFPLPSRSGKISIAVPNSNSNTDSDEGYPNNNQLECALGENGSVQVSGILIGRGKYVVGQAEYPIRWKLRITPEDELDLLK